MELSPLALALIGLLLAAWTMGAAVMIARAVSRTRRYDATRKSLARMTHLLDEGPAIPLLVRVDGRIEAPERLAGWLGLAKMPAFLSELAATRGQGLDAPQLAQLSNAIDNTQKSAMPFHLVITPAGSKRHLTFRGALANPQFSPGGAALIWVFDFSESERELSELRLSASTAQQDFASLMGLVEAAPIPMWFRTDDGKLRLVNAAYVEAVGAEDASQVVREQIELLETVDGISPQQLALQTLQHKQPVERIVTSTILGERRSLRVSDLPLNDQGVSGYAIDIEDMESLARQFRAFRDAQRAMLDQLSVGVAQFASNERLVFANQPFHRLFELSPAAVSETLPFDRFLSDARENGRTPEVRDFPEWRQSHMAWFGARTAAEEQWPLPGGTHLRIVAQPMPDGGLVLIAEDRTEQLALSATRDTLLRTRTATLDSLFEAIAVFAPDGSLQLWNRSFPGAWGIDPVLLDAHPSADKLVNAIKPSLLKVSKARILSETIRAATLDRKHKGGRLALTNGRVLEFAGVPLPDGNGLLTVLDVTDSEMAERALRERNQALQEADAIKARFLANMSYELRTPLTSIGGFAELIASGAAGPVPEPMGEYVSAILDSVAKLTKQVENVLDLSQSEAGQLPLNLVETELLAFLTDAAREREQALSRAGLSLKIGGNEGIKTRVDKRQLGRAIGHLIDNAIAGTDPGGQITIELARVKSGVRIIIADNGRGMDAKALTQALDGLQVKADGTIEQRKGLGIPLARQLIEAHGGTFALTSEPGKSTRAVIRLP